MTKRVNFGVLLLLSVMLPAVTWVTLPRSSNPYVVSNPPTGYALYNFDRSPI